MFDRRNLLKKLIIEEKHLRLHTLDRALIGNGLREIIRLGITPSGLDPQQMQDERTQLP